LSIHLKICIPPLFGWNDWPSDWTSSTTPCQLSSAPGYVAYSALGSFYLPMAVIIFLYARIFVLTRRIFKGRVRRESTKFTKATESKAILK
jgi:5-hydroxytryptamine receptor 7